MGEITEEDKEKLKELKAHLERNSDPEYSLLKECANRVKNRETISELIKELKNQIVRNQDYESAAIIRDLDRKYSSDENCVSDIVKRM